LKYARILCVSDLHFPYCHIDTLKFLKALKEKYDPDIVVLLGDELDYHAYSFHASDPDLDSAGQEFVKSLGYMDSLYDILEGLRVEVCESNHGSMTYRKAKVNGTPRQLLKTYKEALCAPRRWNWHRDLVLRMSNGQDIFFCHGFRRNALSESQRIGMNFVQGHHHTQADIRYWAGPDYVQKFGMTVGCMIDDYSLAYDYNKINSLRPVISHAIIEEGVPKILPMFMDKKGRWNGKTP